MSTEEESSKNGVNAVAIGIALGLPLGSAVGMLAFDNIALGGGIGLLIGIVFGAAIDANGRNPKEDANDPD
ncbi:hypothetical protein [Microbacterium arborescens]|uniref:hypothetical protein n=1 Tax=Microbacterium arborescens TaxID=33883 RepID=UPI003C748A3D